jgi:hypothetical protein
MRHFPDLVSTSRWPRLSGFSATPEIYFGKFRKQLASCSAEEGAEISGGSRFTSAKTAGLPNFVALHIAIENGSSTFGLHTVDLRYCTAT